MDSRTIHNYCLALHRGSALNPDSQQVRTKYFPQVPCYEGAAKKKRSAQLRPAINPDIIQLQSRKCQTMPRVPRLSKKLVRLTCSNNYDDIAHSLKYEDQILNEQVEEFRNKFGDLRSTQEPKVRLVQSNWPTDNSVADALFEEQTRMAIQQSRLEAGLEEIASSSEDSEDEDWEMVHESKSDTNETSIFQDETGSFVQVRKSFRSVLMESSTQPFVNIKRGVQTQHQSSKQILRNNINDDDIHFSDDVDGDANLTGMPFEKYDGYRRSILDRRLKRRWK